MISDNFKYITLDRVLFNSVFNIKEILKPLKSNIIRLLILLMTEYNNRYNKRCPICLDYFNVGVRLPLCACKTLYCLECYIKAYYIRGCPTCGSKYNIEPFFRAVIMMGHLTLFSVIFYLLTTVDDMHPAFKYALAITLPFPLLIGICVCFITKIKFVNSDYYRDDVSIYYNKNTKDTISWALLFTFFLYLFLQAVT